MFLPAVFLILISSSLGLEKEPCYPELKPLLQLLESCRPKDEMNGKLQKSLNEVNVKYSELLEKQSTSQNKCINVPINTTVVQESQQQINLKYSQVQDKLNEMNLNAKQQEQNLDVQKRLNELNNKYELLQETHTAAHDRRLQVEVKLAQVQEKLENTNRELEKSQESLHIANIKNKQVQDMLTEANRQVVNLQAATQRKDLELNNLSFQLKQQKDQNTQLQDQISDLKKSCELGELTNLLTEELEKLRKITKKAPVEETENSTNRTPMIPRSAETNITMDIEKETALPDGCPLTQDENLVYRDIQLPGSDPFQVACLSNKVIGSGWMEVFNKFSLSFNRTYEEYVNGFGNVQGEIFLGLEKLHRITTRKPHEVTIFNWSEKMYKVQCDYFAVGNKTEGYMLKKLDGCTGDTSHFNLIQGTKFSAFDRDEDGNNYHEWANELGFGWWFNFREEPSYNNERYFMAVRMIDEKTRALDRTLEEKNVEKISGI